MSRLVWFVLGGLSVIGVAVVAAVLDDTSSLEDDETANSIKALPPADTDTQAIGRYK